MRTAAATEPLQTGLHDLGLGGVEHHGCGDVGGKGGGQPDHVGHAVPPDVVHTEVDEVGALLHLILADGDASVEVVDEKGFLEGA